MTYTRKNYSDQDVIDKAKQATSLSSLLRLLGLKPSGGNYDSIKSQLQKLNVDTSHWTGQCWNKDQQLKDWSQYAHAKSIKPHLLKERGHCCESCKLSEWLGQPITIEIDHVDGNRTNNSLDNLKLLCPNCHSQTSTWKGRKLKLKDSEKKPYIRKKKIKCVSCSNLIEGRNNASKKCKSCFVKSLSERFSPSKEELLQVLETNSVRNTCKFYKVARLTLIKKCQEYGIDYKVLRKK
jgi:Zn finger protein HypA/HybF involved in hydrogenase expression